MASAGNKPTKVTRRTVAIRFIKDDRKKFGILDDALLRILGSRKAKAIFTAELAKAKLIPNGHGHAGTIQHRIPIKRRTAPGRRSYAKKFSGKYAKSLSFTAPIGGFPQSHWQICVVMWVVMKAPYIDEPPARFITILLGLRYYLLGSGTIGQRRSPRGVGGR